MGARCINIDEEGTGIIQRFNNTRGYEINKELLSKCRFC